VSPSTADGATRLDTVTVEVAGKHGLRLPWTCVASILRSTIFMAFPGEEPPQIECNADAGGQDTDE
jgi:hypothetical protein